ncbi:MAG: thioredoxin domain-containing protein [Candidatus Saccharimonadales bacterium]
MSNKFFITVLVVIALVIGAFAITKKSKTVTSNVQPTNHIRGNTKGGVALLEYGDYQCPACGQYHPIINQVMDKYGDKISFQFRNFPLTQIHKNAFLGARAAEAADKQGKFWEMNNMLYDNQQVWSESSNPTTILEGYAKQLGLNEARFKTDSASEAVNDIINADLKAAQALKLEATPSFFINGKKIDPLPRSAEEFYKLIDKALADKAKS